MIWLIFLKSPSSAFHPEMLSSFNCHISFRPLMCIVSQISTKQRLLSGLHLSLHRKESTHHKPCKHPAVRERECVCLCVLPSKGKTWSERCGCLCALCKGNNMVAHTSHYFLCYLNVTWEKGFFLTLCLLEITQFSIGEKTTICS